MNFINDVEILFYSHTHSPEYEINGIKNVFEAYRMAKKPTVSIHLDRFAGLARQQDIGKEASWNTEYYFSADHSPEAQELYKKTKQKHYYLPPAVDEDGCYIAETIKDFPYDIVFVGSKGYHYEYPFRKMLIEFLQRKYGTRFGHYGNDGIKVIREHELNQVLSSAKIAIGDSCFGGRHNYVSDRLTETVGRGGFIITPDTETLGIEGVETYKYPDLNDLKSKIDYWLKPENQEERIRRRNIAHKDVKKNHTYTNRMREILEIIAK